MNPDGTLPDAIPANDAWKRPDSAGTKTSAADRRNDADIPTLVQTASSASRGLSDHPETPLRSCWPSALLRRSARGAAACWRPAPDDSARSTGRRLPFRRLDLPTPNTIRTGERRPGPDYWQQRVDYVIRASLDTVAQRVTGEERITYTNNSPDTLRYLWLQLDQNLFNSSQPGLPPVRPGLAIRHPRRRGRRDPDPGGAAGGAAAQKGRPAVPRLNAQVPGQRHVDEGRPAPPAAAREGRQVLDIGWSFPFGPNSNRMGIELIDGSYVYEVAQWYPRLAVYDDVRGWNTEQYLGQGEFYLEYGSFDVSLTVPANMLVAATGTLRNPAQVLTATQRARLARARTSDTTVVIRGMDEIGDPASRPPSRYRHAHLAVHRRQRARLRLGRRPPLRLGRGPGQRRQDAGDELLSAVGRAGMERVHPVRPLRGRQLLILVPLSLPRRHQRERHRGRDGVPDDRLLPQPHRRRGALQRDRPRDRPHLVSHGRGEQRAAATPGWTKGSTPS